MAVSFRFSVDWSPDSGEPLSGFELGDMDITGSMGTVSSAGRTPDQSMMVFVSATMLLDGLRRFLTGRERRFRFHSVDSSFQVVFQAQSNDRVRISSYGIILDEVTRAELVQAVADCGLDVFSQWSPFLPVTDAARIGLEQSVQEFVDFRDSGEFGATRGT